MTNTSQRRYDLFGLCVETGYRFRSPMVEADPDETPGLYFVLIPAITPRVLPHEACIYVSPDTNRYGEHGLQLYLIGTRTVMRFPRVADFIIARDEIICELYDDEYEYMVEIYLLGYVISYYLESVGVSAVHAGAISIKERAVLFSAKRGTGKSTVIASLVAAGFPLVADDIAALESLKNSEQSHDNHSVETTVDSDDGCVLCRRSFPQLKLMPEQAMRFAGRRDGFERVHPESGKLGVPVGLIGDFAVKCLPVAVIYLIDREVGASAGSANGCAVRIEPVSAGEAVVQLARNSFLSEILEEGDNCGALRPVRFRRLAGIAQRVPMKRLRYPSGYERLGELHEAVLADVCAVEERDSGPDSGVVRTTRARTFPHETQLRLGR